MSKVRRLYHQKYREDWEKFPSFSAWLCRGDDGFSAHCKICDANVLARLASIKQHHNTAKHQKALSCSQFGDNVSKGSEEHELQLIIVCFQSIPIKLEPSEIKEEPKPQRLIITPKTKPKIKRFKTEKLENNTGAIEQETCSNDSILEDLLGNEDLEQQYLQEMSESDVEPDIKPDSFQEFKMDDMQDDLAEENIISEFDLFGKSVALQLNHMEVS